MNINIKTDNLSNRPYAYIHITYTTVNMDPYSAEGELINIFNFFHQGQYQEVVDFDTSSLSPENHLPARLLQLRAQIQLGHAEDVEADVQGEKEPALIAVGALAQQTLGKGESAVSTIEKLAAEHGDNGAIQVIGGTVLAAAGKFEDALALLSRQEGNLEAVALIVHIHLQQNRTDLALKEVNAARRWAQDNLLVNLAEAWVGLRQGGDKYQQSFYVFEELAQAPATSSVQSLVSQAVSELHLGRTEEAQAALDQASSKGDNEAAVVANQTVLDTISGRDAKLSLEKLGTVAPHHQLLTDIAEKEDLFNKAAAKYRSVAA